jgi:hypothetical protein
MYKHRARRAQAQYAEAQLREMDPDIPRFVQQGSLASHAIITFRRIKRRNQEKKTDLADK